MAAAIDTQQQAAAGAAAGAVAEVAGSDSGLLLFSTKFEGKVLELPPLSGDLQVGDLKQLLQDETEVPCERQKLIGLVKGKIPADDIRLSDLALKKGPPYVFTLMGTRDEQLFVYEPGQHDLPEVMQDLDYTEMDFSALSKRWHRSRRHRSRRRRSGPRR